VTKEDVIPEVLKDAEPSTHSAELTVAADVLPTSIYLIPLTERPFFPAQTLPLLLDEQPWQATVQHIVETPQKLVGLLLTKANNADKSAVGDFFAIGSVARIHHPMGAEGKIQFIAEGLQRFRVDKWLSKKAPYYAQVEYITEPDENQDQLKAYAIAIINILKELVPLNPLYSEELKFFLNRFGPNDPSPLVDFAASITTSSKEELQDALETISVQRRMEKVLILIRKELEVARLQARIRENVEEKITEQQRRFFLKEQLKIIQKDLGITKDDRTADLDRFRERLTDLTIPDVAAMRIDDEMNKLSLLETGSPEYSVTRNYLDILTDLPWGIYSQDLLDFDHARTVLNRDHYGLDDVKQRIIEFLAVGTLKGEVGGSILLFVGPPGVGKTSIGRSIANTLGRKFYRFSLGGMRDEAEIKGHRRTYVGAIPGRFIHAIKEARYSNPVIMLDEIDKIGASYQGDPASALLEVLDPEQNKDFLDHYLDVRFDLSRVLFICTANQLDTIPSPLLDRMEVIRLAGYISEEKLAIAKYFLWPNQLKNAGLGVSKLKITDSAIRDIIEGYAREAGVRSLEKQLRKIIRKAAVKFVEGHKKSINVSGRQIESYLGKPLFKNEPPPMAIGVATGLAWTTLGGVVLSIEASLVHSKNRGLRITGQLGTVMQESAQIAYSFLAAHLQEFQCDPAYLDKAFVHIHVPAGATPKDGPSAGITMATALLSLARGQKPSKLTAMTGELTLTGSVLPVGGIREKVTAARRNRIKDIILPEANRRDFEELPDYIQKGLKIHFVSHYDDVAGIVFPRKRSARE